MWKKTLNFLIDHYTITFLIITVLCMSYKVVTISMRMTEAFLICFLTWNVGIRGILAFISNWFNPFADQIAARYNWPLQSSFQREIASAEGAFGVLGLLCNWTEASFWSATIIGVSFCWFFSELGGLVKISKKRKDSSYNLNHSLHLGMRLDFVFSILLFGCYLLWINGY